MIRAISVLLALASVATLAGQPAPAPVIPTLVDADIERYFETLPSIATQAGRHDFDM